MERKGKDIINTICGPRRLASLTVIAVSTFIPSWAADPAETDSASMGKELNEVVIAAPKVIHKVDCDVYQPSRQSVELSNNGMDLLQRLQLPAVTVNTVLNTVTTNGQSVELRVNGRKASIDQVKSITPSSVKRVEYHDNPGLRYGEAVAVIDIIVSNPLVGGSFNGEALQMLAREMGNVHATLNLNNNHSQFTLSFAGNRQNKLSIFRDYNERFVYPDASTVTRVETPLGGSFSQKYISPWLSYSYNVADQINLWVGAGLYHMPKENLHYDGRLTYSDSSAQRDLSDYSDNKETQPWLTVYLERQLPRRQTIVANFELEYVSAKNSHLYRETSTDDNPEIINDVLTDIRDHNQSYNLEADYIKKWDNGNLTAGVNYLARRNRSTYESLDGAVYHQRQDRVYMFGEYQHRIGNFNLTAGLGATYVDIKARESGRGSGNWGWRPRLSVSYRMANGSRLRLTMSSYTASPSLSQTNEVAQQIDGFQWLTGNASLNSYTGYRVTAQYNFTAGCLSGRLQTSTHIAPKAIFPVTAWDGDRLVTSYDNNGHYTSWNVMAAPQIEVIPDWVNLSGALNFSREWDRGTGYRHAVSSFGGDLSLMVTHWNTTLMLEYTDQAKRLWGETVTIGERYSTASVTYQWRGLGVSLGMFVPVGRYRQGSESLNRYNTNTSIMRTRSLERQLFVNLSYGINWGHQKQSRDRLIDGGEGVEKSSAAGR